MCNENNLHYNLTVKAADLPPFAAAIYRLNFDLDKKNEIHYHSWKERLRTSKTAKIGC